MLLTTILASLLSSFAYSAPVALPASDPNYNCGYVFTKPNESVYAGLSAYDTCTAFYYNQTINNYQDAYAYNVFGGCTCGFYSAWEDCVKQGGPYIEGPTRGEYWEAVDFAEPKPKWYNCAKV